MKVQEARVGLWEQETRLLLSASEQKTLQRASQIAEQARALAAQHAGFVDWEGTAADTMLAGMEHAGRDAADDGYVVLPSVVGSR